MTKNRNNVEHWRQRIVEGKPARQTKQRNIQSACPTCGAALPHDNPMSKQFHQMQAARAIQKCPVCHAVSPSDEHLLWEYKEMMLARYGAFKNNAQAAQNEVAALLFERGITSIPNIFGDIPIQQGESK